MTAIKQSAEQKSHAAIVLLCMIITIIEGYNLIVYGSVVPLLVADPSMGVTSPPVRAAMQRSSSS